jgi:DNA-binding CsgD family transcriptional regulator
VPGTVANRRGVVVIRPRQDPPASSVVLAGAGDEAQRWTWRTGSPSGRLRLLDREPHDESELVPRPAPGLNASTGPERGAPGWEGMDAEAVVLVRPGATRRGIADAVTALETPYALLLGRPEGLSARLDGLTPREQEVLTELALGKVNKEIARTLHLTGQTAQRYVRRVLQKLRVTNRTEAARVALLGDPAPPPDLVD